MYNLYKGNELIGTFKASEIAKKLNLYEGNISKYSTTGYTYRGDYRIERAGNEDIKDLLEEWDKARFAILNAPDKITKTMVKVPFSIWKKKLESKVNKYRKNFINT